MSPKPTVTIIVVAQYIEYKYLTDHYSSEIPID